MRRLGILLLAPALLGAVLPAASAGTAAAPERAAAASISITGNGYGHGKGLSQHGAEGRAQAGQSHRAIVEHYYPGTAWGRAAGTISVLISADTTPDVVVAARRGLSVRQVGGPASIDVVKAKPKAQRWRLLPAGSRTKVQFQQGGWRTLRTLRGAAEFSAGQQPVTLVVSKTSRVAYRGALRAVGGDTVNVVRLDDYLRGVVPREVPALWHPEAVRAQAVAARTYAAFERRQPLADHYQVCDTSLCQVYGGASSEHPASDAAVKATRGDILTFGGQPAFTQFSASNGGWSMAGPQSYLRAERDPFDTAYRGWRTTVTGASVERAFTQIGTFTGAQVVRRDGDGQWGGRVVEIRLTGTRTSTTVSGDTFRSIFGLRSTYFTL